MDNVLQTALAEAVNSLASFFGTTTEAIMAHAPEFLAKYGWYSTLNEIPINIFVSLLLTVLIALMVFLITMGEIELKHPVLAVGCLFMLCVMICVGSKIITCMVTPEIVGAHAILNLLKSMG